MSKFQIIVLCVFGAFILAGLATFGLYKGNAAKQGPAVTIWGTLDQGEMTTFIHSAVGSKVIINYVQKPAATFDSALASAIAVGTGPDAILISQDQVLKENNKILQIPYTSIPQSTFKSTYIQEAELYMNSDGISAIPFTVDPLVMYWNRDLLSNANIAQPPAIWNDLVAEVPTLTVKDDAYNITQSAVGIGEYSNVDHAKSIVAALMLQTGNQIVNYSGNSYTPDLNMGDTAVTFYTQFANPIIAPYTWNRSLVDSKNLFIGNKLAFYFGMASEYQEIASKNPNLNYDVALFPQLKAVTGSVENKITYGDIYGFSVVRTTQDPVNTLNDIYLLTSSNALAGWSGISGLPSVRRDALTPDPNNPVSVTFDTSALWARGWYDPDSVLTNNEFGQMISSITSGQLNEQGAIGNLKQQLGNLLQ